MKLITAIIKPFKLEDVRQALGEADPASLRKAASHCASLFLEGLRVR